MRRIIYIIPGLLLLFGTTLKAQSGCPGCVVNIPAEISSDTFLLTSAPSGQVGIAYDEDISFRLPLTTDAVIELDSTAPPGFNISQITVQSISNLPPGLSWELSQSEFDLPEEQDGCLKICGTPLQPGLYEVNVLVSAQVVIFSQSTNFTFPILIEPSVVETEGFSMVNNSGCGEVTVSFINNIPSDGADGFSYSWDFGNGTTSINENPFDQTYSEPGAYEVTYEAVIDTAGFTLSQIEIQELDCGDTFGGAPDLYIQVFDPNDTLLFESPVIENATLPVSYTPNLDIGEGDYKIRVLDDDRGLSGGDDVCGTITFNQQSGREQEDEALKIRIALVHPVTTVSSSDSIFVFAQPDPPTILELPSSPLCEGDEFTLMSSYSESVQWFRDSVPIFAGDTSILAVSESGTYWVSFTSPDGCISTSESLELSFGIPPRGVAYTVENNLLSLADPSLLPENASIEWFINDILITDANNLLNYCIDSSGVYSMVVTDLDSGCSSLFSRSLTFDPTFPGCVSSTEDPLAGVASGLILYPNPTYGPLNLQFELVESSDLETEILDIHGRVLLRNRFSLFTGTNQINLDISHLPSSLYILNFRIDNKVKQLKFVRH